jgi:IMP dehydrogenase
MITALTYDDITLVPQYSEIESRQNIDLTTQFTTNYKIRVPLIASPMDTVCDSEMAIAMAELGGVGIIHRFMTIEEQSAHVQRTNMAVNAGVALTYITSNKDMGEDDIFKLNKYNRLHKAPISAAIGANGDYLERAQELVKNGANVILIDVAHGHHKFVKDALRSLKQSLPSHVDIIAGNVATYKAARDLTEWGADALRVGIGGGSLCTTRVKTGFGVPNVSSLSDCASATSLPIIACGGIRNSGDIAKALAVGANSVILGSLIAGTKEAPGQIIEKSGGALYKRYRGAASLETKSVHGQAVRNVEGESTVVPFKGGVKFVVEGLLDGVRSALSYAGANMLSEFSPEAVIVTNAGVREAQPHLL